MRAVRRRETARSARSGLHVWVRAYRRARRRRAARRDNAERCVKGTLMFRAALLAVGGGGGGDGLGFVAVEENVALLLGGLASTIA